MSKQTIKYIDIKEVGTIKMVAGNETKFSLIVHDGYRKRWVGFGWVTEGEARYPEDNGLPHVAPPPCECKKRHGSRQKSRKNT